MTTLFGLLSLSVTIITIIIRITSITIITNYYHTYVASLTVWFVIVVLRDCYCLPLIAGDVEEVAPLGPAVQGHEVRVRVHHLLLVFMPFTIIITTIIMIIIVIITISNSSSSSSSSIYMYIYIYRERERDRDR